MKVSIHQPQYLPWLPYIQKIDQSDLFIFNHQRYVPVASPVMALGDV